MDVTNLNHSILNVVDTDNSTYYIYKKEALQVFVFDFLYR